MRNFSIIALASTFGLSGLMAEQVPVYFGTGGDKGIYKAMLDSETGNLSNVEVAVQTVGAGSLSISPDTKVLYSTTRKADANGKMRLGGVASYSVQNNGDLKLISAQPSKGSGACHIFAGRKGKNLFVANYGSGCVASFQVDSKGAISPAVSHVKHEGSSVNQRRQTAPHAHSIYTSPDNKFVYAADLGTDEVFIYKLDEASGKLTPAGAAKVPAGGGPRHMAFNKDGSALFVLNELTLTISKFSRDADSGQLKLIKTGTVTKKEKDDRLTCSEIRLSKDGKFIYAAKRCLDGKKRDSICVLDPESLEVIQEHPAGIWIPRNFNISPSGKWLLIAGQKSNQVVVLKRDVATGKLSTHVDKGAKVDVDAPMWILFP